ncbi:MAG: hypothetical protein K8S21_11455 [Gemmatimonadetes bacterium]|nr:hypothetical protein [Gemmatimonadota bacterium]
MPFVRSVRGSLAVALSVLLAQAGTPLGLGAQATPTGMVLVQTSRADVVLGAPAIRDAGVDLKRMSLLIDGCRRSLSISEADSAAAVTAVPDRFVEPEANGRNIVVFTVLPNEGFQAGCGDPQGQSLVATSRGLRISFDTAYTRDRDIEQVVLRRGDRVIVPLASRSELVRRLGVGGFGPRRSHLSRVAFDLTDLAPSAGGGVDSLVLEVRFASSAVPELLPIPWPALREVWESTFSIRPATEAAAAPMPLPEPMDEVLRDAHAAYASGDPARAIRVAAPRLVTKNLPPSEARNGRVILGLSFFALRDTSAARVAFGRVVESDPCFTLAATSPAEAKVLVDALSRPYARCTSQALWFTAAKSAVLPGFGRPVRGAVAVVPRVTMLGLMVGAAVVAASSGSQARDRYDEYLAYQNAIPDPVNPQEPPSAIYADAEALRTRGRALWAATAAAWSAQVIHGVWKERRHAQSLAEVQQYGRRVRPRAVGVAPILRGSDHGLSVSITW